MQFDSSGGSRSSSNQRPAFLTTLGLLPPVSEEDVKQAYLVKVRQAHPDHGGSADEFIRIQQAYERALEYVRFKAGRRQWLARWIDNYAEQESVMDEIRRMGGQPTVETCDWVEEEVGPDFATVLDKLIGIRLEGSEVDDRFVSRFAQWHRPLAALRTLELVDTQISSAGAGYLTGLTSLRRLDLSGSSVGPRGAEALIESLPRLEWIGLRGTRVGLLDRLRLRWRHPRLTIAPRP